MFNGKPLRTHLGASLLDDTGEGFRLSGHERPDQYNTIQCIHTCVNKQIDVQIDRSIIR